MNSILSLSYPNAGSSNAPSHGSKSAGGSGKTANENSKHPSTWSYSLSSRCCSKDRERVLTDKVATGATMAVVYDPADAASKADAEGIKKMMDGGLEAPGGV